MNEIDIFDEFHETPIYFYPIHKRLVGRATTAILLSYIIRQLRYHKRDKIYNTDAEIKTATALSKHELALAKESLQWAGFVDITREGEDGITHYSLNRDALKKALQNISVSRKPGIPETGKPRASDSRKPGNPHTRENPPDEITHTLSRPGVPGDGTAIMEDLKWRRMAERLAAAISQTKKINCNSSITGWARSFKLIHTQDDIPIPRLRAALRWYCERLPTHFQTEYFLDIQSGAAFRDKYLKVEAALAREARAKEKEAMENSSGFPGDDDDIKVIAYRE